MSSNASTSLPPTTIVGDTVGREDKQPENTSSTPSKESNKIPAVMYDPPPASWFFNPGSNSNRKLVEEQTSLEKKKEGINDPSSSQSKDSPFFETNDRHGASNQANPNPGYGMVSDNEEEDEDLEGFNFIAVSKSLLMAGSSFEAVQENENEPPKVETDACSSEAGSEKCQGVLIMEGRDTHSEDEAPVGGSTNNQDASMLTVPGSDSLPSDIGSISSGDGIPEQGDQNQPDEDAQEDPYLEDRPPLIHRFLQNIQQTRRLRLVSDASDENGGDRSSGVSVVRNDDEDISVAWTMNGIEDHFRGVPRKLFWRRMFLPISLFGFLFATTFAYHSFAVSQREQREVWEQRLQEEKAAMARILVEKESLRYEMEILVEEAAVATARAESLVREQERLVLQQQEAEKAEKERLRLLQEKEERKEKERQRRREQPWRSSSSNEEDFGWFFNDSDEGCSAGRGDGSASFTIANNCWIKAKADFNLGSCSSDTKDFFSDLWSSLLGDWENYFDDPTRSDALERISTGSSNDKLNVGMALPSGKQTIDYDNDHNRIGDDNQNREGDSGDQGRHYQYQDDDTYYPPQDPLKGLFSAIQSAGQSFVNKLTNLVNDEVENGQIIAREMEETVSSQLSEASRTISDAMETAKEDMRDLSKETLSVLRTAVQKSGGSKNSRSSPDAKEEAKHQPPPTQQLTRKALFDAADAVKSLFESVTKENIE